LSEIFTEVLVVAAAANSHPVMILLDPLERIMLFCPTTWVFKILLLFDHPYNQIPLVLFMSLNVLFEDVVRTVPLVLLATVTPENIL